MANKKSEFSHVRRKIEDAMEAAEEERRRKILSHRLDLARAGVSAYRMGRMGEAVKAYHTYLRILEEDKNVAEGNLSPSCFDPKKELAELLMVSAIFWDLTRVYDLARSQDKKKEFRRYLEKYILFSKGQPYQPVCAETLRKYLQTSKPVHRSDFRHAYEILRVSRCFIVSALVDQVSDKTVEILRDLKEKQLRHSWFGRKFIYFYYRMAPKLAQFINLAPEWVRRLLGIGITSIAWLVDRFSNSLRSENELAIRKTHPKR